MGIIKTVTNGDRTAEFKAISLGSAVAIGFGLCSIIGAQQTWLWAGAHERDMIVTSIRLQITNDIQRHADEDSRRFSNLEREQEHLVNHIDEMQKQILLNTGKLNQLGR